MRIHLIRHGETIWNAARIIQRPETPLSERGQAQAAQLRDRMRGEPIVAILSSDYSRAHATAQAVHEATGAPITIQTSLRERNLGDHRGTAFKDLTVDVFHLDYHPPNGESWSMFYQRVETAWREVETFARSAGGDIAVVSHALVCRALVDRCVPVPDEIRPQEIQFGNTSVTQIDGPPFAVSRLACTEHLNADQVTFPNHPKGM